MAYTLTEKLWYTADHSRVVPDGDPEAAFLLGPAGHIISDEEAARLGLKGKPAPKNKAKAAPENKGGVTFEPETKGSEGASSGDDDTLPEDFPAVDLLAKNGITTRARLAAVEDLESLEGIGETWAERIREAL